MSTLKPGVLYVAATPIGNIQDASQHLISALRDADVIACEDTRKTKFLLNALEISTQAKLMSHHEHNERERIPQILQMIQQDKTVVVVSDAGMPAVSDPGFPLVQAAVAANIPISVIPGASAVTTALVLSGLPTDRFVFEGFLPRKSGERKKQLQSLAQEHRTIVVFESGHRIKDSLENMMEIFGGNRKAALCRELTKTYEEVIRGSLAELVLRAQEEILGEITLVIAGAEPSTATEADIRQELERLAMAGTGKKEAISEVCSRLSVSKRKVFDIALSVDFKPLSGA
jgi:16S rRNA (cytidine1402-2'-O)-methyltransferase